MFTEINLEINSSLTTSTGGTVTGAKVKIFAASQGVGGGIYNVGGFVHENCDAEDSEDCEPIKIVGLHSVEEKRGQGPKGTSSKVYFEYFGLTMPVASFADLDSEEKRVALVRGELASKLGIDLVDAVVL
jgi:hypothetical protein